MLRTAGVESESPLPYAALHRLLRPVTDFDRLPAPQARALRVAFGLEDGPTVEPFLVGVATLSVLTDAAEPDATVLCVVDDAHWLDSASADALLFAARQLAADPVAMVFAARTGETGGRGLRPDRVAHPRRSAASTTTLPASSSTNAAVTRCPVRSPNASSATPAGTRSPCWSCPPG